MSQKSVTYKAGNREIMEVVVGLQYPVGPSLQNVFLIDQITKSWQD